MSTIDNKYLVLRGKNKDIYFIQKRVSKAVSKIIGKDFIKKSLDTTDINVAREKRDKILQELDNIANKHALIDEFDDNTHDQTNFNDVNQKILSKKDNIFVPIEKKEEFIEHQNINNEKYTLFSLKLPKLPKKDEIIMKIDKIIPIAILIITIFVAFIV
jgi:hypothetical protein